MRIFPAVVLVAGAILYTGAAYAKNETAPGNTNERIVAGVAGPNPPINSSRQNASTKINHPSKAELKNAKIKPKPKLQDPN